MIKNTTGGGAGIWKSDQSLLDNLGLNGNVGLACFKVRIVSSPQLHARGSDCGD